MNTLLNFSMIAALLAFTQQCGKEDLTKGAPDCIQQKIKDIAAEDVWNPPAKVYSYLYNGKNVFLISQHCCDIPSVVLDQDCNVICSPSGGFSGRGDGKCVDFVSAATDERLIWEDKRKTN